MTVDHAISNQAAVYWFTVKDVQFVLRVSRNTIFRHLGRIPPQHRVKVSRHLTAPRTTRYWRISPEGLRILGHATGQAPYL